jgi:hypothetical protein
MSPITYPIPISELSHFYIASGNRSSTIVYEINLDVSPDPKRLTLALAEALSLYPNFAVRLYLSKDGLVFAPNTETPLVLLNEDPVSLGEEEVHHYLFALSCVGNRLRFRLHHGLADGRGCLAFVKCVLGHYFGLKGPEIDPEPLEKDAPVFKPYLERHLNPSAQAKGVFTNDAKNGIYVHPEPRYPTTSNQGRVFEITCPMKTILRTAKRDDSTPAPYLAVLIANAYRNIYPVGNQTIAIGCAVDYRPIFHDDCRNNGVGSIVLPYFSKIAQYELPMQRTLLRGRLDLETQEENLIAGMTALSGWFSAFKKIPLPAPQAAQMVSEKIEASAGTSRTAMISYVGGVRWPASLDVHLKSIAVFYAPFACSPYFMGIEDQGLWHLSCTQVDESDKLCQEIYRLLSQEIPEARFSDRGVWAFDGLHLERMPALE